jgi:dynein heavy chain 1
MIIQVDDLLAMEQEIDLEVKSLETCAYSSTTFSEILGKIQKAVDNLSLHSYSNLPQWVARLDDEVCGYYVIYFVYKLLHLLS